MRHVPTSRSATTAWTRLVHHTACVRDEGRGPSRLRPCVLGYTVRWGTRSPMSARGCSACRRLSQNAVPAGKLRDCTGSGRDGHGQATTQPNHAMTSSANTVRGESPPWHPNMKRVFCESPWAPFLVELRKHVNGLAVLRLANTRWCFRGICLWVGHAGGPTRGPRARSAGCGGALDVGLREAHRQDQEQRDGVQATQCEWQPRRELPAPPPLCSLMGTPGSVGLGLAALLAEAGRALRSGRSCK